jgi:NAD(P)-dependent dehydrogenase (short-subunit alcohol dehydrogenase family)
MDLQMRGNVAVITGGASGIGWACARAFALEGCNVALWDLAANTEEQARHLADTGAFTLGCRVDICDGNALRSAMEQTESVLGAVSHLVHAAAIGSGKFGFPFTNLQPVDWQRVLEVNVMGMVQVAHTVAPAMRARQNGSMIFIGSVAGQIGSQTDPPYSASKAANINFARCLAKDLAPQNIRVNVVNPGMVKTSLNRAVWEAWWRQQAPDARRSYNDWGTEKVKTVAPLGRWQQPEDIADMVVFLSSPKACQITGQTVNVDGGQVMHG